MGVKITLNSYARTFIYMLCNIILCQIIANSILLFIYTYCIFGVLQSTKKSEPKSAFTIYYNP